MMSEIKEEFPSCISNFESFLHSTFAVSFYHFPLSPFLNYIKMAGLELSSSGWLEFPSTSL